MKADACNAQGPASKCEVGGAVSFSESGDARQKQALLGKLFEDGGTLVAEALGAGLMVLLPREVDGPSRPIDGLGG